jgi:hypothetical protein
MTLANDDATHALCKAMIRDMIRDDTPRHAGWTVDVARRTARPAE